MKEPGPDHPITIALHPRRVRVTLAGTVIADTTAALALAEASYPPVLYIPRDDVRFDLFAVSARTTHCPYKGEASHFNIAAGTVRRAAAAWSYEAPFPAVARIRGHLAFYPDKVDDIEEIDG